MVFEDLINPLRAESNPKALFYHGFIYASLGLFLGMWIFEDQASLILVFLTTMAALPLIYNIIRMEEKKDLTDLSEKTLLKEHSRALSVFMYYFLGATLAFSLWFTVLPNDKVTIAFQSQMSTLTSIRSNVTGNAYKFGIFSDILTNNLKVVIFCILFSFIYGMGALFILTWNASVIGVAIGDFVRKEIFELSSSLNLSNIANYFQIVTIGLFRYTIHGIPEILAYFMAGLAGGIISVAAIRHDFGTKKFEKILMDSSVLLLISLLLIVSAAVLEVWVTPMFFA